MSPHIPEFPPKLEEWLPLPPPALPVPSWMINPSWLSDTERATLTAETGKWATSRAEAMIPSRMGPDAVRRAALSMLGGLQRRYGIEEQAPARARRPRAAPTATPVEPRRQRQPRAATVVEQAPTLTSKQREQLMSWVEDYTRQGLGTRRGPALPATMQVQNKALEMFTVEISEAVARDIIAASPRVVQ